MKRSLIPWIGLFLLASILYSVSLYVSGNKLLLSGRYTTTLQQYSADNGVWKERIEVDLNNENLESTVSIEEDGLEGVALFAVTGEITKSCNGEFEFFYRTEPIQTTKVLDGYQAASYSSLFLSGMSKNQLIYRDENLDVIAKERNHIMLSRVW